MCDFGFNLAPRPEKEASLPPRPLEPTTNHPEATVQSTQLPVPDESRPKHARWWASRQNSHTLSTHLGGKNPRKGQAKISEASMATLSPSPSPVGRHPAQSPFPKRKRRGRKRSTSLPRSKSPLGDPHQDEYHPDDGGAHDDGGPHHIRPDFKSEDDDVQRRLPAVWSTHGPSCRQAGAQLVSRLDTGRIQIAGPNDYVVALLDGVAETATTASTLSTAPSSSSTSSSSVAASSSSSNSLATSPLPPSSVTAPFATDFLHQHADLWRALQHQQQLGKLLSYRVLASMQAVYIVLAGAEDRGRDEEFLRSLLGPDPRSSLMVTPGRRVLPWCPGAVDSWQKKKDVAEWLGELGLAVERDPSVTLASSEIACVVPPLATAWSANHSPNRASSHTSNAADLSPVSLQPCPTITGADSTLPGVTCEGDLARGVTLGCLTLCLHALASDEGNGASVREVWIPVQASGAADVLVLPLLLERLQRDRALRVKLVSKDWATHATPA